MESYAGKPSFDGIDLGGSASKPCVKLRRFKPMAIIRRRRILLVRQELGELVAVTQGERNVNLQLMAGPGASPEIRGLRGMAHGERNA